MDETLQPAPPPPVATPEVAAAPVLEHPVIVAEPELPPMVPMASGVVSPDMRRRQNMRRLRRRSRIAAGFGIATMIVSAVIGIRSAR